MSTHSVVAWGDNRGHQLGDSSTSLSRAMPALVSGLKGVIAISGGRSHTLALTVQGEVWVCGDNSSGQLGTGTNVDSLVPTRLSTLNAVVAIAAGADHSLALKADGTVWAWGSNRKGQLGDGTTTDRPVP